ncbi:MAG: LytR/AlgR family response regulator transcription factor, partial [Saprospiraceae bacterium]
KILLLEDEKLAAQKLLQLLYDYFGPELEIKWVQSVQQGLQYLVTQPKPDLILSDIELLDGKVFKLYEQFEVQSPIIFITAYDQYLLEAFQTNGIAYLLKPFSEEELEKALEKYLKLFRAEANNVLNANLIGELKAALTSSQKEYRKRFTIKKSSGIFLLRTEDIAYFTASDDLVFAVDTKNKRHVINFRLSDLVDLLDPLVFFRINRSEIVNINFIEKMEAYFGNRLVVVMKNDQAKLKTSGPKTAEFRKWVDGVT